MPRPVLSATLACLALVSFRHPAISAGPADEIRTVAGIQSGLAVREEPPTE